MTAEGPPGPPVQSVDRALAILQILAEPGRAGGHGDRLPSWHVHKSTAFRLLAVPWQPRDLVEQLGRARQVPARLRRRPAGRGHRRPARPRARRQANLSGTGRRHERDRQCRHHGRRRAGECQPGARKRRGHGAELDRAAHAAACHLQRQGAARLADADALAAVLKAGLERRTAATITDPEALRAELDRIRQRGWACTVEELETGLTRSPLLSAAPTARWWPP